MRAEGRAPAGGGGALRPGEGDVSRPAEEALAAQPGGRRLRAPGSATGGLQRAARSSGRRVDVGLGEAHLDPHGAVPGGLHDRPRRGRELGQR